MTTEASTTALVAAAADGDRAAWDALVDRYAGLVVGVCRRIGLAEADIWDVSQTIWLRLVEQLASLRDPEALPGWLATAARREALALLRQGRRMLPVDVVHDRPDDLDSAQVDAELLVSERRTALRQALDQLPDGCRRLLLALLEDPQPSYAEVSRRFAMPIGSIGPARARCLERLRRCPAILALGEADSPMRRGQ